MGAASLNGKIIEREEFEKVNLKNFYIFPPRSDGAIHFKPTTRDHHSHQPCWCGIDQNYGKRK